MKLEQCRRHKSTARECRAAARDTPPLLSAACGTKTEELLSISNKKEEVGKF